MQNALKRRFALKLIVRLIASAAVGALGYAACAWYKMPKTISVVAGLVIFSIVLIELRVPAMLAPGWDGVVKSKTVRYVTTRYKNNIPEYELIVTDEHGREHRDVFLDKDDEGKLNRIEYYNHGERVRRHRGFKYFERFDKSDKNTVICIDCGTLNPKERDRCKDCGLILLKDNIDS